MDIRIIIILLMTMISLIILYLLNFYIPAKQYKQTILRYKRKRLLNEQEGRFYVILSSIIPEDRRISCKIRMEDMINVTTICKNKLKYRNQINCRQIDFVVYDPISGSVDYAIELNTVSNDDSGFKDAVFCKIGIPLLRFQAKRDKYTYSDIIDIAEKIEKAVCCKQYCCSRTMFME